MYLNQLNEKQSNLFLDIALHMSKCDEDYSSIEKDLVLDLCEEMEIPYRDISENNLKQAAKLLSEELNHKQKKMIFLELMSLAFVDESIDPREENAIHDIASIFGLSNDDCEIALNLIKELGKSYMAIAKYINK